MDPEVDSQIPKDQEEVTTTFISKNQKDSDVEVNSRSPREREP